VAAEEDKELSKKLDDVKINGGESQENGHESSDEEDVEDGNTEEVKGKTVCYRIYNILCPLYLVFTNSLQIQRRKRKRRSRVKGRRRLLHRPLNPTLHEYHCPPSLQAKIIQKANVSTISMKTHTELQTKRSVILIA